MNECSELYKGTAASMGNANTVEDIFREKLEDKSTEAEIENRRKADWNSAALSLSGKIAYLFPSP